MKRNVTSVYIVPSIEGALLKFMSLYIHSLKLFLLFFRSVFKAKSLRQEWNLFCVSWLLLEGYY